MKSYVSAGLDANLSVTHHAPVGDFLTTPIVPSGTGTGQGAGSGHGVGGGSQPMGSGLGVGRGGRGARGGLPTSFYHADGLGSIRTLTNEQGIVTNTRDYTAFGEARPSYVHPALGTDQRYANTGREDSPLATTGAPMYYRYRQYDPSIGRFTRRDPAGYPKNLFGNLYQYVDGNAIIYNDPFGLDNMVRFDITPEEFFREPLRMEEGANAPSVDDERTRAFKEHLRDVEAEEHEKNKRKNEGPNRLVSEDKGDGLVKYGYYGGPGWTGGEIEHEVDRANYKLIAWDSLDEKYRQHDIGYGNCEYARRHNLALCRLIPNDKPECKRACEALTNEIQQGCRIEADKRLLKQLSGNNSSRSLRAHAGRAKLAFSWKRGALQGYLREHRSEGVKDEYTLPHKVEFWKKIGCDLSELRYCIEVIDKDGKKDKEKAGYGEFR